MLGRCCVSGGKPDVVNPVLDINPAMMLPNAEKLQCGMADSDICWFVIQNTNYDRH